MSRGGRTRRSNRVADCGCSIGSGAGVDIGSGGNRRVHAVPVARGECAEFERWVGISSGWIRVDATNFSLRKPTFNLYVALIEFALNVDQPGAQWSHFFFKDKNIARFGTADATVIRADRYFAFYGAIVKR